MNNYIQDNNDSFHISVDVEEGLVIRRKGKDLFYESLSGYNKYIDYLESKMKNAKDVSDRLYYAEELKAVKDSVIDIQEAKVEREFNIQQVKVVESRTAYTAPKVAVAVK